MVGSAGVQGWLWLVVLACKVGCVLGLLLSGHNSLHICFVISFKTIIRTKIFAKTLVMITVAWHLPTRADLSALGVLLICAREASG